MKIFLIAISILFLAACSNVKDLKFTKDNQEQVMEKIRKSKDLTGEDFGLLMAALMRTALSGSGIEGKTVGQVIEEQRRLFADAEAKDKEAKRLAAEAAKKEAEVAAELSKYILVAPYKKRFTKASIESGEFLDKILLSFTFENRSTKDIRAFQGTAIFKDLFGTKIRDIQLTIDEGIKAGHRVNWNGEVGYNEFIPAQRKFRDTDLKNMKYEWKPEAIIFADGSKIGIDNQ